MSSIRKTAEDSLREKGSPLAVKPPDVHDFLQEKYPEPAQIAGPIKSEQVIIGAGETGLGKTNLALALAHACCTGTNLFDWVVPRKRKVLYVDGEMSGRQLQERLHLYDFSGEREDFSIYNCVSWASANNLEHLNLAEQDWQDALCHWAKGYDVVSLDNVMSLLMVPGMSFSSDEFWRTVIPLNLRLRAMGCTVIWWDHVNAEGRPFGTRTKEWGADLVFTLKKNEFTDNYNEKKGAAFTLAFRKVRGAGALDNRDIDVEMQVNDSGSAVWSRQLRAYTEQEIASEHQCSGLTQRQIAVEMGISVGKVNKLLKDRIVVNGSGVML